GRARSSSREVTVIARRIVRGPAASHTRAGGYGRQTVEPYDGLRGTLSMMASAVNDRLPTVVARGVGKTFRIPEQRVHTLKERVLHPRRRIGYQTFRALDDISFAVEPGEFFGIAGRNGSGKSTLLKCIAGIYGSEGDIWCRGRLSTF